MSTGEEFLAKTFSFAIQVFRYSALAAGVVYGAYHQTSLNSQARRADADREYARKAQLIEQAKAEWKKKTAPQQTQTQGSGGMFPDMTLCAAPVSCANRGGRPKLTDMIFFFSSDYGSLGQPL